ncbi:31651_t:CDS:2, partial [Racocetra persica]
SSIYNSHGIEKEKQNEISVEHSANVVSDDTDLFNVAIKVGQKENLCWYCFYKAYEDRVEDCKVIVGVTKSNAHVIKSSEVTAPNSLGDSKVIGPDNSPKANDYDDTMPSSMEKGTNEVQTDYDSDCSHDNDSEEDVSFSDNDKINDIDTMVSDDEEDVGYYYDLRT